MGCIPYQTTEDAIQSLTGSTILYRGRPFRITEVTGPDGIVDQDEINLRGRFLPDVRGARYTDVPLSDPDLQVNSIRLGYVNFGGKAVWLSRFPAQGRTQGLHGVNVSTSDPNIRWDNIIGHPCILDVFTGTYPTPDVVIQDLQSGERESGAFHRVFSLTRDEFRGDYVLRYKEEDIGFGTNAHNLKLSSRHSHLKDQLKEIGLNVQAA